MHSLAAAVELFQRVSEKIRISLFSWGRVLRYTSSTRLFWGDAGTNGKLPHSVLSVKSALALQYSAWRKTFALELSRAIQARGVSAQRPAVETCPPVPFVCLMDQKHLAFLPSFLPLARGGNTILFSLGGSVLVDL